jgi:hypothetical protein
VDFDAGDADVVVTPNGVSIPTSRGRLEGGFQDAGFGSYPNQRTAESGTIYVDPRTGNKYRVMEGQATSGQDGPRLQTHAAAGNPLSLDGSPIPNNVMSQGKTAIRDATHLELKP